MALREKTIEYAFNLNTGSLASATNLQLSDITVHIPETSSRTFLNVQVVLECRDSQATAGSITATSIGIQLGAAAVSNQSVTSTITNSGEHQTFIFTRDFTSYFNTNFGTGTSQTCNARFTLTGIATNGHSVKLIITYRYDDTGQTTRVKTVRIPLGSYTSTLTNALTNLGTNSIPALDTFLPEAGKVYRNIWFEISANSAIASTTTFTLAFRLDAEAETQGALSQAALNSATFERIYWVRNDMTTNTTHNFSARSNNVTARYANLAVLLCVTYEYNHSTSTQVINSVIVPLVEESGFMGTSDNKSSRAVQEYRICEPGTITTQQSGVHMFFNANGANINAVSMSIRNGTGTTTGYTRTNGSLACGQYGIMHAIEPANLPLSRGNNKIELVFNQNLNTTHTISNVSAILYLNYTSDIATAGDAVHNQTRIYTVGTQIATPAVHRWEYTFAPPSSSDAYRTTGIGYGLLLNYGAQDGGISWTTLPNSNETSSIDEGWISLYTGQVDAALERGVSTCYSRARYAYKRYTDDPQLDRLELTTPRNYRLEISGPAAAANLATTYVGGIQLLWTYNNMYTSITRSVSGFDGDGSGINVRILESGSDTLLYDVTTVSGGNYSFIAYDVSRTMYATAIDTVSGKLGRSNYFTPFT